MLVEEGACKEMMEQFTLMREIEQNTGKQMSKIINKENEWDQIADADTVEGQIERVMRE